MIKLNLGCGMYPEPGWLNSDILPLPGVQMVMSMADFPWGMSDESVEEIKAIDVIEHLPHYTADGRHTMIALMEEIWRVLIPGGKVYFRTSDARYPESWIDITHTRTFMPQSFDYFDEDKYLGRTYGFYSPAKFRVAEVVEQNKGLNFTLYKVGGKNENSTDSQV